MMRRRWSESDDAVLRANYPNLRAVDVAWLLGRPLGSVYRRAKALGLRKSAVFLGGEQSGRTQGGRGGRTRFQKGSTPWNKGTKGTCGTHPNCRRTQFRPGTPRGRAALLKQPIGAERVTKDGLLQRKVNNDLPLQRRWRSVHSLVWEEVHGPIPPGHKVVFRPGQRTSVPEEITVDRLELVTHADLMRRNSYHNRYPKDVGLLIQMKGQLTRQINKRTEALREEQS